MVILSRAQEKIPLPSPQFQTDPHTVSRLDNFVLTSSINLGTVPKQGQRVAERDYQPGIGVRDKLVLILFVAILLFATLGWMLMKLFS